jgi:hypothetical protein
MIFEDFFELIASIQKKGDGFPHNPPTLLAGMVGGGGNGMGGIPATRTIHRFPADVVETHEIWIEGAKIQLYNVLFTTLPLLLLGMWDTDVKYETALKVCGVVVWLCGCGVFVF